MRQRTYNNVMLGKAQGKYQESSNPLIRASRGRSNPTLGTARRAPSPANAENVCTRIPGWYSHRLRPSTSLHPRRERFGTSGDASFLRILIPTAHEIARIHGERLGRRTETRRSLVSENAGESICLGANERRTAFSLFSVILSLLHIPLTHLDRCSLSQPSR